jgi:hypothetical protein
MFSYMFSVLNHVFDDQRLMVASIWVWLVVVLVIFSQMGLFQSDFVRFGPSPTTIYVGITLDTWQKWSAVAIFSAVSSFMNDMANESLEPFFLCVIRDVKGRYVPFSKLTCVVLTQAWTMYASVMSLFALYTYFSQVDFVLIKLLVGLMVNMYSTMRYLRNKKHEPKKFAQYFQQHDVETGDGESVAESGYGESVDAKSANLSGINYERGDETENTACIMHKPNHQLNIQSVVVKSERAEDDVASLVAKHTEHVLYMHQL